MSSFLLSRDWVAGDLVRADDIVLSNLVEVDESIAASSLSFADQAAAVRAALWVLLSGKSVDNNAKPFASYLIICLWF